MNITRVSIGRVKRDISELVNRVAFGQERIVLTSRGKPKAALVSMEDFTQLTEERRLQRQADLQRWLAENHRLNEAILQRRGGQFVDVDAIWQSSREELEQRHGDR